MRAVRVHNFGGPDELKLEEVPDAVAGPGEVLLKIEAIGINPLDTYIRSGIHAIKPDLPFTSGGDAAGKIIAVGDSVTEFAVDERVYLSASTGGHFDGAMAEMAAVSTSEIFHLPDNTSYAEGAALGVPYSTAYYGLHLRGRAKPGETVFIHGASGSVGTATVQMARALGMTVIGSAGSAEGCRLVEEQGAHHVLNHLSEDYMDELHSLTGGKGPDLIIEMLANVNLAKDLDAIGKYGRIVIIGSRGEINVNPRTIMMKDVDIIGLAVLNATDDEIDIIHAGLRAGLESGVLKPVIRSTMSFENAAAAHEEVLKPGAFGKIIITP